MKRNRATPDVDCRSGPMSPVCDPGHAKNMPGRPTDYAAAGDRSLAEFGQEIAAC
ncbi:hypothetical protein [Nonomuraea jabiensis]|uniref:hypothetical protein n=1 Tax=Nonomuraea jabiensis TaxID=882448 RepID=UPI0036C4D21E